jgi:hypothetical protein
MTFFAPLCRNGAEGHFCCELQPHRNQWLRQIAEKGSTGRFIHHEILSKNTKLIFARVQLLTKL